MDQKPNPHQELLGKKVDKLLSKEETILRNSAYESDITKLMKAVVAQRMQIEALEQDKLEQNQKIAALESDKAEGEKLRKELE